MTRIHDKQKYYEKAVDMDGVFEMRKMPRFRECNKCGKFLESTSKMLTYWDTHCLNCGGAF